jgi:hypothetical protein
LLRVVTGENEAPLLQAFRTPHEAGAFPGQALRTRTASHSTDPPRLASAPRHLVHHSSFSHRSVRDRPGSGMVSPTRASPSTSSGSRLRPQAVPRSARSAHRLESCSVRVPRWRTGSVLSVDAPTTARSSPKDLASGRTPPAAWCWTRVVSGSWPTPSRPAELTPLAIAA